MDSADLGYHVLLGILVFWGIFALFGILTTILNGKVSDSFNQFIKKKPKRLYK